MKKLLLIALLSVFAIQVSAQRVPSEKKCSIAAGYLNGGGGLIGVDFEYLMMPQLSVQAGVGVVSFGGAINYHFKPYINSSMMSLSYFHQGIGDSYFCSWLGPMYTFRAPKVFQASIGYGLCVDQGPAADKKYYGSILFTFGVYFPI